MQAIKLDGVISKDHRLMLTIPPDIPSGPVEVVVLVKEKQKETLGKQKSLQDFLAKLEQKPYSDRSAEEVDAYIEEMRNSFCEKRQ